MTLLPTMPEWIATPVRSNWSQVNNQASSASERRANIAAIGERVPIIYGRDTLGAKISLVARIGGKYVVRCIWCHGGRTGIDGIDEITCNGNAVPSSVQWTHYLGTPDQGVDPTLASAVDGYTDTLTFTRAGQQAAFAYSVAQYPASLGFLEFDARIRGLKLYDPRDPVQDIADPTTWVWSDTAALAWADYEASRIYGPGRTVDWDSAATLADANEETLADGTRRRRINLSLLRPAPHSSWIEVLRTYAGGIEAISGSQVKLIADRPAAITRTLTDDDIDLASLQPGTRGLDNRPTVVTTWFTATDSSGQTVDRPARAYSAGVAAGTEEWREETIRLPGIDNYAQALRESKERLNYGTLIDKDVSFETYAEGLQDEVGDVIRLVHSIGVDIQLRLLAVTPIKYGRWSVKAERYDSLVYSNSVESDPSSTGNSLPNPRDIPQVTDLVAAEEFFPLGGGIYASVFRVTFTSETYLYQHTWEYSIRQAGTQIWQGPLSSTEFLSGIVERGRNYEIAVRIVGFSGLTGEWQTMYQQAKGIELPPSDVAGFSVDEYGGEVYAAWKPGIDVLGDRIETEWRYGSIGCAWETARFINRARGFTDSTKQIPHGEWDFLARHIDSFENYSENVARVTRKVTLDSGAWLVERQAISAPVLVNMVDTYRVPGEIEYQTDLGQPWVNRFANAMDTYPLPMPSYQAASGTVSWSSEIVDMELSLAGTWEGHIPGLEVVLSSNPAVATTITLRVTDDDPAGSPVWTVLDQVDLTAEPNRRLVGSGQGRYAQLIAETYHETTDVQPSYFIITTPDDEGPDSPYIRIDAIPGQERHAFTSHATNPVTITLNTPVARLQGVDIASIDAGDLRVAVKWDVLSLGIPTQLGLHVVNTTTGKKIGGIDTEIIVKFIPLESA